MTCAELLHCTLDLLQHRDRVSYRALAQTEGWDDQWGPDYKRIRTTRQETALSMAEVLQVVQGATCWML